MKSSQPSGNGQGRFRHWLVGGVALLLTGLIVKPWLFPEPKYEGRTVSEWVHEAEELISQRPNPSVSQFRNNPQTTMLPLNAWYMEIQVIQERFVRMGSNVAPHMVDWMLMKESAFSRQRRSFAFRHPRLATWLPAPRAPRQYRETGLKVLVLIGPQAARQVPRLSDALADATPDEVRSIVGILGSIGPAAAPAALPVVRCLRNTNSDINSVIAETLIRMGPDSDMKPGVRGAYIEALRLGLRTSDARARAAFLKTIRKSGADNRAFVPDMLAVLADEWFFVRAEAVRALGEIAPSDPIVRQALERLQNDANQEVREAVQEALNRSGHVQ